MTPTEPSPELTVDPRWWGRAFACVVALLAVGHGLAVYLERGLGHGRLPGSVPLARLLNMDGETNVPAWFATCALLACAGLCAVIWRSSERQGAQRAHWAGLVVILAFLSIDEGALIHEELSRPMTNRLDLDAGAWRYWAWVLPYSAAALVAALAYARFLWRLPSSTRTLLLVAGATFVAGAAGMELVGRDLFDPADIDATYLAAVGVEEVLELTGVGILLYALLDHLRDRFGGLRVSFAGRPAPVASS